MSPEWLTAVLRGAGALPRGAVRSVEWRANAAFNSATAHLLLTYSEDAPAQAPRGLLLKRNKEGTRMRRLADRRRLRLRRGG
jgi:hypothetical protein